MKRSGMHQSLAMTCRQPGFSHREGLVHSASLHAPYDFAPCRTTLARASRDYSLRRNAWPSCAPRFQAPKTLGANGAKSSAGLDDILVGGAIGAEDAAAAFFASAW